MSESSGPTQKTEPVVVAVECRHAGQGELAEQEPTTLLRVLVRPGEEPRGVLLVGRLISGDTVLQGSDRRSKWRSLWLAGWESHRRGEPFPYEHLELTCSTCGATLRIPELVLRRQLARAAEAGVSSVPIHVLPVK